MTELEIINFAHDFNNLINSKNCEIGCLRGENQRLTAVLKQLTEPSTRLTVDTIQNGKRPVYCFHTEPYNRKDAEGFWAVPLKDGTGVICPTKGVLRYSDYERTWYAFSAPKWEEVKK